MRAGRTTQPSTQQAPRQEPEARSVVSQDCTFTVTLRPIPVPKDYHELNYKPAMLETWVLLSMLSFNTMCILGLVLIVVKADAYAQYHSHHTDMRFVIRYIPTIVGTLTTLMFRSMRDTLARTKPYICMASERNHGGVRGSKSVGLVYTAGIYWGAMKTRLSPHHQDWLRWALWFASIPISQITGYKAALFTGSVTPDGIYVLTVHKSMAFLLMALYSVVITSTIMTLVKMMTNKTGLMWDPVTIADQMALFHGSNALDEFRLLEQQHRESAFDLLAERSFRLGYWERVEGGKTSIWYGIGKTSENDVESDAENSTAIPDCPKCNRGSHTTFCSCNGPTVSTVYPSKVSFFSPWFLFFWLIPIAGGLCLCVYTAASSRVNKTFSVHNTWWSYVDLNTTPINATSPTNSSSNPFNTTLQTNITSQPGDLLLRLPGLNFNPANDLVLYIFVFRSIPTILASNFVFTWISPVDRGMRFSQPFANMYFSPASASDSILLSYLWGTPGLVTIDAFNAGHYKVFWFSLLDLFSPVFPILVAGLFTITNTGEYIVLQIIPVTFYFVLSFLVIYLCSLVFTFPGSNRRLLRWHLSVADYASLFYASRMLNDTAGNRVFDISGKGVTSRHLYSRVFLEEDMYRVGFYTGVDKQRHWGIDKIDKDGKGVEFLDWREWREQKREWQVKEKQRV